MVLMLVLVVWATPLILYLDLSSPMSIYFSPHSQSFHFNLIDVILDQFLSPT